MSDLKSLKDDLDCIIIDKNGGILGSFKNCLLRTIGSGMQQCTGCIVFLGDDTVVESEIREVKIGRRGSGVLASAKVLSSNNTNLGVSIKFENPKDRSWVEMATGLKLKDR